MRCKWGDLISLEYGKPVSDKEMKSGSVPVFGTNGQIGTTNQPPLCPYPSFVIGRKGAYRGVHFSEKPFSVIDTAFYVKSKTEQLDLKWAYYKFLTYDINGMDSGSAIPSTDRHEIYRISLDLPSLEDQRTAASILSSLDAKIANNKKINHHLASTSVTDNSPDTSLGRRLSRKFARLRDSKILARIRCTIGSIISLNSLANFTGGIATS